MSENQNPNSTPSDPNEPSTPAPVKKKRRGWWWKIPLVLLALLVLLVALAPTIISWGIGKSIAQSQAGNFIKGRLAIDNLSVGWTSGVKITGVKIFDEQNKELVVLNSIDAPVSLIDAARGKIDLKGVMVDARELNVTIDENGKTNLEKLLKETTAVAKEKVNEAKAGAEPGKLPDITGDPQIKLAKATILAAGQPPVYITNLAAKLDVANINQSAKNSFSTTIQVGENPPGTIKLDGDVSVIQNNLVNLDNASAHQVLEIANVDIASALPFIPPALLKAMKGNINGSFGVDVANGKSAVVGGTMMISEPYLEGPLVKNGGKFAAKSIQLTLAKTQMNMPNGPQKWQDFTDIQNDVIVAITNSDGQVGKIQLNGKTASTSIETAETKQNIELTDLDAGLVSPFLDPSVINSLKGKIAGKIGLAVSDGKRISPEANIAITGCEVSGPALKGDTFKGRMNIIMPKSTIASPKGLADWKAMSAQLGSEKEPIVFAVSNADGSQELARTLLFTDLSVQAVLDVLADKTPGIPGRFSLITQANAGQVAGMLPKLFHVVDGVSLEQGTLRNIVDLTLSKDDAKMSHTLKLEGMAGTQNGKKIALQPIETSFSAISIGGMKSAENKFGIPRLRDLHVGMKSAYINADINGPTLANIKGPVKADLAAAQSELSQVIDFGKLKLAGMVDVLIESNGDLVAEGGSADAKLTANITGLNVQGLPDRGPVKIQSLNTSVSLTALRGDKDFIHKLDKIVITSRAGDATSPTLDFAIGGALDMTDGVISGEFHDLQTKIDLRKVQEGFGGAIPELKQMKLDLAGGVITAAAGKVVYGRDKSINIENLEANGKGLTINRDGRSVVNNYSMSLASSAALTMGQAMQLVVSRLELSDSISMISAAKTEGKDFKATITPAKDATPMKLDASADLSIGANLPELSRVAAAFSGQQQSGAGQVKSGQLSGKLSVVTANGQIAPHFEGSVADLSVTTPNGVTDKQNLKFLVDASASDDMKNATVKLASINSNLVNAVVENTSLDLATKVVFDMVRQASVKVDVVDVPGVMSLAQAFAPAVADIPVKLNTGRFSFTAVVPPHNAGEALVVNLPDVDLTSLALRNKAGGQYPIGATKFNLSASVTPLGESGIKAITVSSLSGDLGGIAKLSMPNPVTINDPTGTNPLAAGEIRFECAKIEDLTHILEFLADAKMDSLYPLRGSVVLSQKLGKDPQNADRITAVGSAEITKLVALDKTGKPVFTEDRFLVENNVWAAPAKKNLGIVNFSFAMKSSNALAGSVKGEIYDWETARKLGDSGLNIDLTYDLKKLIPVVRPFVSPELQAKLDETVLEGQFTKQYALVGALPAGGVSLDKAIRNLMSSGSVAIQKYEYTGLNVQDFVIPYQLKNGIVRTVFADRPEGQNLAPPASVMGGKMDISDISIDLNQPDPRLNVPKKRLLLQNVSINPIFAKTWMKKYLNNPIFSGARAATGVLNLTVVDCRDVPLSPLVLKTAAEGNTSFVRAEFSINNLNIGGEGIGKILSAIMKTSDQDSFVGHIDNGWIEVQGGIANQSVIFETGQYKMGFIGKVRLSDQRLIDFKVIVPGERVAKAFGLSDNDLKWVPETISVPLEGTLDKPSPKIDKLIADLIGDIAKKRILGELTGQNKNTKSNPKDPKKKDDPVGDLIDIFGGNKKKK